jgi:hypothetical protein
MLTPLPTDPFRVRDALAAGVGENRLRNPALERVFHGARAWPDPANGDIAAWQAEIRALEHRMAAYLPIMPSRAFFAGPTAAFIHGMPLPGGIHDRLWVGIHHPHTAPLRDGVRGVQVLPRMATIHDRGGVRVTSPADTWAMLGAALGVKDLTAAADFLLRVPRHPGGFSVVDDTPLCSREDLVDALASGRRIGAVRLRTALELARTGSSSRPETWMRLILLDAGLPEPEIDVDVFDEFGGFVGCLDAAYRQQRVGIEYEGSTHLTKRQLDRDIDKYTALDSLGWRIVRLTSTHVFTHPHEAVRRVRAALNQR